MGGDVGPGVAVGDRNDGVGISEIENKTVLEDLVQDPRLADRRYQIVHYDSKDERGIDVALLYNPKYLEVTGSAIHELKMYRSNGERNYTRDVLHVEGLMDGERMHFLVNHWPSRGGGVNAMHGRNAAAQINKNIIDSLQNIDPAAKIILMGDLNDNPNDDSVKKVLKAEKDREDVRKKGIYNPYVKLYKKGYGSNAWRDTWSLFDQVMVSSGLVRGDRSREWQFYQAKVFNASYLVQKAGHFKGYPFRSFVGDKWNDGYSDHFPSYVLLIKAVTKP